MCIQSHAHDKQASFIITRNRQAYCAKRHSRLIQSHRDYPFRYTNRNPLHAPCIQTRADRTPAAPSRR